MAAWESQPHGTCLSTEADLGTQPPGHLHNTQTCSQASLGPSKAGTSNTLSTWETLSRTQPSHRREKENLGSWCRLDRMLRPPTRWPTYQ